MTAGVVNVHKITSFLQIHTAALIPMNENHKRVNISRWFVDDFLRIAILDDEKRVIEIHILINIENAQNILSLFEKSLPLLFTLPMVNN